MTDIRLPGMSGLELARLLVKEYPQPSGGHCLRIRRSQRRVVYGREAATVLMLPKPYDLPDLERTLTQAAAIRQGT